MSSSAASIPTTPAHGYQLGTNSSRHREAATQLHAASLASPTKTRNAPKTSYHQMNLPMWHFAAPTRASLARAEATKARLAAKLHREPAGPITSPQGSPRATFGSPGNGSGAVAPDHSSSVNKTPSRKMTAKQKLQLLKTPVMKVPDAAPSYPDHEVGRNGDAEASVIDEAGDMHPEGDVNDNMHTTAEDETLDEVKISGEAQ